MITCLSTQNDTKISVYPQLVKVLGLVSTTNCPPSQLHRADACPKITKGKSGRFRMNGAQVPSQEQAI